MSEVYDEILRGMEMLDGKIKQFIQIRRIKNVCIYYFIMDFN